MKKKGLHKTGARGQRSLSPEKGESGTRGEFTSLPNEGKSQGTGLALSQRAHRRLIGLLGFLLPFLLYLLAGLRPTNRLPPWRVLDSISAYYYTGAVAMFVGILFALSLFLFSYRGYRDATADRVFGIVGGFAALGVGLFPTEAPSGLMEPAWWNPAMRFVHYGSAAVLFLSFILFSIWLFRKSSVASRNDRPLDKRWRDNICLVCGLVMIASILWAGSSLLTRWPIFWPESIAIMAFAVSWLAKGEAHLLPGEVIRVLRGNS